MQAVADGLETLLPSVAEHLIDTADAAISAAEAQAFLDTRLALVTHETELKHATLQQLQRMLDRSFVTAYNRERRSFATVIPGGSLSLLETSVVDKALAHEALTSTFRNAADASLSDLNVRIAHLFDKTEVLERENPFRPYLLSASLLSAVGSLGLVEPQSSILSKALISHFTPTVIEIYKHINMLLASQDVPAQLPLKPRPRPAAMPHPMPMPVAPLSAERPNSDLLLRWVQMKTRPDLLRHGTQSTAASTTSDISTDSTNSEQTVQGSIGYANAQQSGKFLRSLFGRGPSADTGAYATYSGNTILADSIRNLEHAQDVSTDGESAPTLHNRILENRSQLCALTDNPEEHTVVDVVAMLFEFILRDGQVPEEIRGQLGRMQFLMLKMGLFDPALFSRAHHPAREWLNRIGSVSLGLSLEDASADAIKHKIERMVGTLLHAPVCNAELFEGLLSEFEVFLSHNAFSNDQQVDRAVRALQSAETRALDYAQNAAEMADALAGLDVPVYLSDFLIHSWSLVLERVSRENPQNGIRYRQIVPRLIWSIAPKQNTEERTHMLRLLPELVQTLTEGLAQTRLADNDQQTFLNWLVDTHVVALHDNSTGASASLQFLEAHFAGFSQGLHANVMQLPANAFDTSFVAEAAAEVDATLELLDQQITTTIPLEHDNIGGLELDESYRATVLARLRTGIMVEFTLNDLSRRARLNWVSPRVASLLLTIEELGSPAVISVKLFRRLLIGGQIRFLEHEPLFERAVAALLRTADEMESWLEKADDAPNVVH